jgi:hypothetical protein
MAYTLRGKLRIELEVQRGQLVAQIFVDDQPVNTSDEVRGGWQRMLSAAQSRGRTVEPEAAEEILGALCRELAAADPALAAIVQVATPRPLSLAPLMPLQVDDIAYPIDSLRIFPDRSRTVCERQPGPPLRIRCTAPLALYGEWFGRLGRGLLGAELMAERDAAPRPIQQLLSELWRAGLLAPAPPATLLAVPPGALVHLGHATLLANLGGEHVLVDPFLPPASRLDTLLPPAPCELPPLAAILITHHHWDHVHLETLLKLDKRVPVFLPRQHEGALLRPRTERLLAYLGFADVRTLAHGESFEVGRGGRVLALPFFGEDPTRIGYVGSCYALCHGGRAALVHVDSGTDAAGRSLVTTGALAELVRELGPLSPVLATRRQEAGTMIEHTWEFLLRPADEWVRPTENCNNGARFLGALCEAAQAPWLVLYSEGGADFYPEGTDFLRRATGSARMAPYEYLWDRLPEITAAVAAAGARTHLSQPFELFAIGGGPLGPLGPHDPRARRP